jgi:hypothetical protein
LDQLRENRIKQLASRLVEAALGIGSENSLDHWKDGKLRPRKQIDDPRFAPCHVVIGEDLENYRPEQSRLRSENRRIRDWAARNARKYIMEGCQLNGLYFDEVSPNYTSRQDSRTGAPGVRCDDIPVREFLTWQKIIDAAKKRIAAEGKDSRDKYLVVLYDKWSAANETKCRDSRPLRIPSRGGELFVSADPQSPAAKGIQADLNAAANIGLRALLDPDWSGSWWYVLVKTLDGKTDPKDFPGCPLFAKPLCLPQDKKVTDDAKPSETTEVKKKEKVNVWLDPSALSLDARRKPWKVTRAYWKYYVEWKVIAFLTQSIGEK